MFSRLEMPQNRDKSLEMDQNRDTTLEIDQNRDRRLEMDQSRDASLEMHPNQDRSRSKEKRKRKGKHKVRDITRSSSSEAYDSELVHVPTGKSPTLIVIRMIDNIYFNKNWDWTKIGFKRKYLNIIAHLFQRSSKHYRRRNCLEKTVYWFKRFLLAGFHGSRVVVEKDQDESSADHMDYKPATFPYRYVSKIFHKW